MQADIAALLPQCSEAHLGGPEETLQTRQLVWPPPISSLDASLAEAHEWQPGQPGAFAQIWQAMYKKKAAPLKVLPLQTEHEHGILCAVIDRESTTEQKLHLLLSHVARCQKENNPKHVSEREEKEMKPSQQITPTGAKTTFVEVWKWGQELERLHACIAPRFVRPEPRRRALAYLKGIVSAIERKNGWQLAEHAGEARPDGMQRLLNSAAWDADLVRDDLRAYILERLGDPQAVLVIDETSFRKRGKKSAGVANQHCGTTGSLENCQVGVFLAYISHLGHTLVDRELYLPLRWIEDRQRCQEAGIPDTVGFHTKCEQARLMIERLWQAKIPFSWVVAGIGLWRESGSAHVVGSAPVLLCFGGGLHRSSRDPNGSGSPTDDGSPGRGTLISRRRLAATFDELRHERATTLRLGSEADAASV